MEYSHTSSHQGELRKNSLGRGLLWRNLHTMPVGITGIHLRIGEHVVHDEVWLSYILTDVEQQEALRIGDVEEMRFHVHFLEELPSLYRREHQHVQLTKLPDPGRTPGHDSMCSQQALHRLRIIVLLPEV